MRVLLFSALLACAQGLQPASAAAVTATGVLEADRGGSVVAALRVDSLIDFEAADLRLVFDPSVLVFQDIVRQLPDTQVLTGPPVPDGLLQSVQITYSISTDAIGGSDLEFLALRFDVRGDAAYGPTPVQLLSLDPGLLDFAPLRFDINVRQPTAAVPLPPTLSLVLLALAAAAATRRRRTPATRAA